MDEDVKYDEDKAIEFIRKTLTAEVNAEYDDDDILYIIDIIWEWYEKHGYLDLNSEVTEEEELRLQNSFIWHRNIYQRLIRN